MLNFHLSVVQQIAILALQLGVIIFAAKFCGDFAKKLKMPSVLGELCAGIIIGPCVLGGAALAGKLIQWGIPLDAIHLENGLFGFTPEGADEAWKILIVYAATLFIDVYNGAQVTGTLRCGGDTRAAMLMEIGTVWVIGVPLAFITSLGLQWPVWLAVLSVKSEGLVKSILLTMRYYSRKWLNTVIEGIRE